MERLPEIRKQSTNLQKLNLAFRVSIVLLEVLAKIGCQKENTYVCTSRLTALCCRDTLVSFENLSLTRIVLFKGRDSCCPPFFFILFLTTKKQEQFYLFLPQSRSQRSCYYSTLATNYVVLLKSHTLSSSSFIVYG